MSDSYITLIKSVFALNMILQHQNNNFIFLQRSFSKWMNEWMNQSLNQSVKCWTLFYYMGNWPKMKRRLLIGSLSSLDFATRTTKRDHSWVILVSVKCLFKTSHKRKQFVVNLKSFWLCTIWQKATSKMKINAKLLHKCAVNLSRMDHWGALIYQQSFKRAIIIYLIELACSVQRN